MLLEILDWGLDARTMQVIFGLVIGAVFGIAAQVSRFCLRRAIAGESEERGSAGATWMVALASAIIGFFLASRWGYVDLGGHRYLDPELPFLAIILGGVAFGAGMVLTRGCASRLTVLSATGNLRAVTVLIIFAVVAHATLKGVLAPLRVALGSVSTTLSFGSFSELPMGAPAASAVMAVLAIYLIHRFKPSWRDIVSGVIIGLVPVLGWATTSVLLFDEFEPLAVQSVAFTLPWSDTLFWTIASTSIPAGFGTGLVGGVLFGSFLSAAVRGELKLVGFEAAPQFLRYAAGAGLMGAGGVLAGGCTVGAGLSGSATLSVAGLLALASIVAGALLTARLGLRARHPLVA
ncbi:YeeE/YedE family protein [Yoonia algicola]|uniref:YeeE/YedE family protein n=1 Tax=Yoonia algicola TaxID=3137368 RepID=A0AAN0NFK0_9RHOB